MIVYLSEFNITKVDIISAYKILFLIV